MTLRWFLGVDSGMGHYSCIELSATRGLLGDNRLKVKGRLCYEMINELQMNYMTVCDVMNSVYAYIINYMIYIIYIFFNVLMKFL